MKLTERDGKTVLSVLQQGMSHDSPISAKIQKRGIESLMPTKDMVCTEVVDLLRMDEYQMLVQLELARSVEHHKYIKEIDLQFNEMMELLEYQQYYFLQK